MRGPFTEFVVEIFSKASVLAKYKLFELTKLTLWKLVVWSFESHNGWVITITKLEGCQADFFFCTVGVICNWAIFSVFDNGFPDKQTSVLTTIGSNVPYDDELAGIIGTYEKLRGLNLLEFSWLWKDLWDSKNFS